MKPKRCSHTGAKCVKICLFFLFVVCFTRVSAQDAVTSGVFIVEPPTLLNLGFLWKITGDENRNAKVEVSNRKIGSSEWLPGVPMLRIGGERVFREAEQLEYTVPNQFAGSILDLEPGTKYECRFELRIQMACQELPIRKWKS